MPLEAERLGFLDLVCIEGRGGGKDTNKSVVQTFFFFFTNYLCICISFLAVLGVRRCAGLSLIAARGASL